MPNVSKHFIPSKTDKLKGSWYLKWRENGKQIKYNLTKHHNVTTKAGAEDWRMAKQTDLNFGQSGIFTGHNVGRISLRDFYPEYEKWKRANTPKDYRTIQAINDHILPFFGDMELQEISVRQCDEYIAERLLYGKNAAGKQLTNETLKKEIRALNAMLNKAVAWDHLEKNRAKYYIPIGGRGSKEIQIFSTAELKTLFHDTKHGPWWHLIGSTGMRRGELVISKKDWPMYDDGLFKIESTDEESTKSGKSRHVPLIDSVDKALNRLTKTDDAYLMHWRHPDGSQKTLNGLCQMFTRERQRAGMKKGSIHSLRHSYATHLVRQGTDIRQIQHVLGHSTLAVTEVYIHLCAEYAKGIKLELP